MMTAQDKTETIYKVKPFFQSMLYLCGPHATRRPELWDSFEDTHRACEWCACGVPR